MLGLATFRYSYNNGAKNRILKDMEINFSRRFLLLKKGQIRPVDMLDLLIVSTPAMTSRDISTPE